MVTPNRLNPRWIPIKITWLPYHTFEVAGFGRRLSTFGERGSGGAHLT